MRKPVGGARQPLLGRLRSAIHARVGKLRDKRPQQLLDLPAPDLRLEPGQRPFHHLRVVVLAVIGHQHMADLVDQPHRKQRRRIHRRLGVVRRATRLVHAVGQRPARRQVGKHHVSRIAEQHVLHLVSAASGACDVELHHGRFLFGHTIVNVFPDFRPVPREQSPGGMRPGAKRTPGRREASLRDGCRVRAGNRSWRKTKKTPGDRRAPCSNRCGSPTGRPQSH